MLDGPVQHNWLILISVLTCAFGALCLTIGLFMHYGCDEEYAVMTCWLLLGGGVGIMLGMALGKFTKWHSRR